MVESQRHRARALAERFLAEGLFAAHSALVIASQPHTDAFCASLQAKGLDVERERSRGRLELFDARDTLTGFMAGAAPDWDRFKTLVGVRSRAAGFQLHLVKPLDGSTLLDLIDRDLDRKRARTRGRA
jgi:hypothetical protein